MPGQPAAGRPSAGCSRGCACLGRAASSGQPPVPGAFAGLGPAGRRRGLAEDGAGVVAALLGFGAVISEELRALHGFFQLADLAARRGGPRREPAGPAPLGSRWSAIRWSMMSRPVTPCRSVRTAEIL